MDSNEEHWAMGNTERLVGLFDRRGDSEDVNSKTGIVFKIARVWLLYHLE